MKNILTTILIAMTLTGCSQYALVNSDVYNDSNLADYHTFRIVTPDDGSLPPGMQMVTYYNIAAAIREQLVDRGFTEDPNSNILVNIGLTVKKELSTQVISTPQPIITPPPVIVNTAPAVPAPRPQRPSVQQPSAQDPLINPEGSNPGLAAPPAGSGLTLDTQQNTPAPAAAPAPVRHAPLPAPGPVYNGLVPYYIYPHSYYWPSNSQVVTSIYREGVLTMDIVNIATKVPLYSSSVATILDNGDTQFRNLEGIAQAVKVLFSKFPVPLLPQYR